MSRPMRAFLDLLVGFLLAVVIGGVIIYAEYYGSWLDDQKTCPYGVECQENP